MKLVDRNKEDILCPNILDHLEEAALSVDERTDNERCFKVAFVADFPIVCPNPGGGNQFTASFA